MSFDWCSAASRLLKSEIAREGLTLGEMAARLTLDGEPETDQSVRSKLSRGSFSMAFFLRCMAALGHDTVAVGTVFPTGKSAQD